MTIGAPRWEVGPRTSAGRQTTGAGPWSGSSWLGRDEAGSATSWRGKMSEMREMSRVSRSLAGKAELARRGGRAPAARQAACNVLRRACRLSAACGRRLGLAGTRTLSAKSRVTEFRAKRGTTVTLFSTHTARSAACEPRRNARSCAQQNKTKQNKTKQNKTQQQQQQLQQQHSSTTTAGEQRDQPIVNNSAQQ